MNPKVSVIVPCYNVEQYVKKCIDSILENDYESKEILVIDDGSTDGTLTILEQYTSNPWVKVISKENSGVSDSRNRGLREAEGKYVLFVDSDDWIERDTLTKLVTEAESTQSDVVFGGICVAVEKQDGTVKYEQKQTPHIQCQNKKEIYSDLFADLAGISSEDIYRWNRGGKLNINERIDGYTCGRLYRKSIIDQYHIRYRTDLYMKEDTIFNLEYISYAERVSFVDAFFYFYRIRRDRSNVVGRLNEDERKVYDNKLGLLRARTDIRYINKKYNQVDILEMYCGSIVLSAIEVALYCAKNRKLGRKKYRAYIHAGVYESARALHFELKNLKFNIVLLILKLHGASILYLIVKALTIVGWDEKLVNI